MRSIKPGRGPSMMGAAGAVFAVIFGIIWTFAAAGMFVGVVGSWTSIRKFMDV